MNGLREILKSKEIMSRILFSLFILFLFRLGSAIPAPGINAAAISAGIADNSLFSLMNLLGGGSLQRMSIFALGIGPYITSSIVINLMSMDVIPYLTDLAKLGQQGRHKIDRITRYLTVVLSFAQSVSLIYVFDNGANGSLLEVAGISSYIYIATIFTAGTMLLLWMADRISSKGIGNGVSLLIFAGIVSGLPFQFIQIYSVLVDSSSNTLMVNGIILFSLYVITYLIIVLLVIFMQKAVRKIPIQYTSTNVSRQGKDITFLPIKVNSASVIPVIFAGSLMIIPQIALTFFPGNVFFTTLGDLLKLDSLLGLVIYAILVILFTFFYTNLQVDPVKIAENLNKSGTYIPGIRPGVETKDYLFKVINRVTVLGALFLVTIALIPYILPMVTDIPQTSALGGTGLIIVVGVAMETVNQIQGMLSKDQYKGYYK